MPPKQGGPATHVRHGAARKGDRIEAVLQLLRKEFRGRGTELHHQDPFQLLIATILSAQCTDERVNMVTPGLFSRYPTAHALAAADQHELENEIRSTGFFRMKAKNLIACSRVLAERHGGMVPRTMEELTALPGVGRKTANVVLGQAFGITEGIVVDTHVFRVARRLGFSKSDDAEGVEKDLMKLFARKNWIFLGTALILHGRKTCAARKPKCPVCKVREYCPSAEFPDFADPTK